MQSSESISKLANVNLLVDSDVLRSASTSEFDEKEVLAGCIDLKTNRQNSREENARQQLKSTPKVL